MYLTLGELIDKLEKLREKHDSAVQVGIDDADTHWTLAIQTVEYDPKEDRVLLGGDYIGDGAVLQKPRG